MCSPKCPRRWDYTWEALSHIGALRLFLSCSLLSPSSQCQQLTAALDWSRHGRWTVHLRWVESQTQQNGGGAVPFSVRVPLPPVVVDHDAPLHCVAMDDHIQVKTTLLLPVDHPLVADLASVSDSGEVGGENGDFPTPFRLENDVKDLSSMKEVDFYCKSCSAKLTKRSFRAFTEVPSVNWREAADNWFGACCCSFGGASEKLATAYERASTCQVDVCAVDNSSVIIYMEDTAGFEIDNCKQQIVPCKTKDNPYDNEKSVVKRVDASMRKSCSDISSEDIDDTAKMCKCLNINEGNFHEDSEAKPKRLDARVSNLLTVDEAKFKNLEAETRRLGSSDWLVCPSKIDDSSNTQLEDHTAQDSIVCLEQNSVVAHFLEHTGTNAYVGISGDRSGHNLEEQICKSTDYGGFPKESCCANKSCDKLSSRSLSTHTTEYCCGANIKLQNEKGRFYSGSLGSGFIVKSSSDANSVEWVEFLCFQCSSLVGTYPTDRDQNVPLDNGIRLFKCHISTSNICGGLEDLFRQHTCQRMFSSQLLESAADELSFHTVVRDVNTKARRLHLILLNSEAWCCTGSLWDADNESQGPGSMPVLQPMIKVLFYDYTNSGESDSRIIEQVATKKQAEEIYMLTKEIDGLSKSLKLAQARLPASCSSLQGLSVSFLER
ncbi:uncharacterized protein LOC116248044 [Nymphaea colorata]|nr:uncharacterized protein LOC116248044 [Nymphaea colorata]